MTRGRLRYVLPLLGLAAALIAIDLIVWGGSVVRLFVPRRDPLARRFRDWYVESDDSPAAAWRAAKAGLTGATLGIVALVRQRWWPLPWAFLFVNLALAMTTRYYAYIGSDLAELTGVSTSHRWGLLWMAGVTGALVVVGVVAAPRSWRTAQLFTIVVVLLGLATAIDLAVDDADTERRRLAVIHLESAVELGMLTIALVHAVHLYRTTRAEPASIS